MNTELMFSSDDSDWRTPPWLFNILDKEFSFDVDVCATPENALCETFYTPEQDGLAQEWSRDKAHWLNPPYGREISKWIQKAYMSAKEGALVVCLIPHRTDTKWYWDYCRYSEVRMLKGRIKFMDSLGREKNSAPFPSAISIFYPYLFLEDVLFWDIIKN